MPNALIVVDVQKDFLPGGALAVPDGDRVIPVINRLLELPFDKIIATGDWHPRGHWSFASTHNKNPGECIELPNGLEQILWPDHCIQGTAGAEISEVLDLEKIDTITHKGMDLEIDSYSVFFDNGHLKNTGLTEVLLEDGIDQLFLVGLTTEYCVKSSALDAIMLGFKVNVVIDGCKGVNLKPGDDLRALEEIVKVGTQLIHSKDVSDLLVKS